MTVMAVISLGILVLACTGVFWSSPVLGHARLWTPPGRSTMWRLGFPTPINYQDNELYCGGFSHQVSLGYKCGLCGDPYDGKRDNEAMGKYAKGIVTRMYKQGQDVTFEVDITANHKGYVEFKVCPTNDPSVKETQECFDRYPLTLRDGSGTKYFVSSKVGKVAVNLVLPFDLTCEFCVVQMRYHTGNSWGTDPDHTSCVGCGHQEEFYGCADIKIVNADSSQTTKQDTSSAVTAHTTVSDRTRPVSTDDNQFERVNKTITVANPTFSSGTSRGYDRNETSSGAHSGLHVSEEGNTNSESPSAHSHVTGDKMVCRGVGGQSSLDNWCQLNCQSGYCPPSHCSCVESQYEHKSDRPTGCRAAGGYATVPGLDLWCSQNCAVGNCPSTHCVC